MISKHGDRYRVEGPVTLAGVTALLDECNRSFDGDPVVVDMSGVTEADSSAISLVLEWTRRMHAANRKILFANLGESLVSIANLYGVMELIPVAAA
jgi:phospholipid transport system transporter-binding protein